MNVSLGILTTWMTVLCSLISNIWCNHTCLYDLKSFVRSTNWSHVKVWRPDSRIWLISEWTSGCNIWQVMDSMDSTCECHKVPTHLRGSIAGYSDTRHTPRASVMFSLIFHLDNWCWRLRRVEMNNELSHQCVFRSFPHLLSYSNKCIARFIRLQHWQLCLKVHCRFLSVKSFSAFCYLSHTNITSNIIKFTHVEALVLAWLWIAPVMSSRELINSRWHMVTWSKNSCLVITVTGFYISISSCPVCCLL